MEVFIAAVICGLIVGLFSGLLGIGGGTLMVPVFRLGFGMTAIQATATSLFTIIPTSISGCITHLKNKTCIPALGVAAGLAGACTSPLGVFSASNSPSWAIIAAATVIILYSAYTMFRKALKAPKTPKAEGTTGGSQGVKDKMVQVKTRLALVATTAAASGCAEDVPKMPGKNLAKGALVGLIAGFASGYVGVGGGFIMVPLFVSWLGVSMKYSSGTSLIAVTILAIPGAISQGMLGNISYIAGIAMAVGSIPGALIGASLVKSIPERKLRFLFAGFLMLAGVALLLNELVVL